MYGMESLVNFHFGIVDYCVFGGMLVLSAGIGVYFGVFKKKNYANNIQNLEEPPSKHKSNDFGSKQLSEYLLGSRKLKCFPVAMSLVASYISGVTILGTPSEIYNYGTQYWLIIIPVAIMGVTVSTVFLPVFTTLKVGSSYEYLEMRFNSGVRTFASVMFIMDEILFLPVIVYVPALAFNQVTGANMYLIGGIVTVVCIFYTILGGLKAVVHTDAWQVSVMFVSVVVVVILGTVSLGGPELVINRSLEGKRINFFNFNPSLYERHTFWGVLIGGVLYWISFNSVNQTMVQRYMSLPNMKKARISVAMFSTGIILFISVCCFAGLLIYAAYYKCDPLSSGLIVADDQLFPVYVMQTVGNLKGIPGLFIAGVFGAALSSLSVVLNSTSAVILEDIIKGCFKAKPSERAASLIVKGSILILGAIAMALLFVIEKLSGVLSASTSLSAIGNGTTFGIFALGMLIPWSNTKGAIIGGVSGAIMSGWVSFGSQAAIASKQLGAHKLPVSTEECLFNSTVGVSGLFEEEPDDSLVFPLYRLSFHWINPIGVLTVLIVGTIVSFLTGPRNLKRVDPDLISPVIHRFLPKECFPTDVHIATLGSPKMNRDMTAETFTFLLDNSNDVKENSQASSSSSTTR